MARMDLSYVLVLCLLMTIALKTQANIFKKTCFLSLRLKTTSGALEKNIEGFTTPSILGCQKIKKDCPGKATGHVQGIFGNDINPMRGKTATKMCELFGTEILPADNGEVDIMYQASDCGTKGFLPIGRLCCFKCNVGPNVIYHPIDNCAPATRPAWCP